MKPTHEQIDDLVRQRLAELPAAAPSSGGWQRLSESLDHPEDAQLRSALTGLAPTSPAGWEALERKLDDRSPTDLALANKLNSLKPAPAAGSWVAFSTMMDAQNAEVVDTMVGDQLRSASGGMHTGWAALAARLELIRERRNCVMALKLTEASLVLSLILLFVRFGPAPAKPGPLANDHIDQQAKLSGTFPAVSEVAAISAIPFGTETIPKVNIHQTVAKVDLATKVIAAEQSYSKATVVGGQVDESQATFQTGAEELERIDTDQSVSPALATRPNTSLPLSASEQIPGSEIGLIEGIVSNKSRDLLLGKSTNKKPVGIYLNAFVSPVNFNQVITRDLPIFDLDVVADNRVVRGSSAGLLVDVVKGKSGLQFGVVYGKTSYIPSVLKLYLQEEFTPIEPVDGYSRFNFETLEIPVSYSRTLHQGKNWRWSAQTTASVVATAKASFYIDPVDRDQIDAVNRAELYRQQLASANNNLGRSTNNAELQALIDPQAGWLEGGGFLENATFYLGGGFTVERLLTSRSSIYVAPSFSRAVYLNPDAAGIGPYQDRLHFGQVRFGARYLMGVKR